ncbi:MAG: HlyD family type I secretion periplasmic adaptor subunit [Burkholderiaceae bacterium]|jgi:hemolysin D|nr:HlyD family type I secretion periplasmic adaptor subunit [Burkholderiaceae bacterium]
MSGAATPRHPAFELLGKYRAVLAAAWAARHELAGPKRLADEAAFLPAALSLQETPVHPAPRRALWLIMALFVIALALSWIGRVDVVAIAHGQVVVSERTKLIQPLETAVVRAIRVKDGDHVSAGQVLVELDPTHATADRRSVDEQLRAADEEATRTTALVQALLGGRPPLAAGDTAANARLQAEWGDIGARLARLDAEAVRRQAELATVRAGIAKLQNTLPIVQQREADFDALVKQGFMASHAGQDRMRERIEIERDLVTQQARLVEAEAALAETRQGRAAYVAETQRSLRERHAKAVLDVAQLRQQAAKTAQREQLASLTAPVAGTVQQLAIHSPGGVVTPAQNLMVIVPDEAEVTAEVVVQNKDIGFVQPGQAVEVKFETFNFTRYGTVPAVVSRMAADAVNDEKLGAIFPATLKLQKPSIDVDGRDIRLSPGMNVTAEIKTGRRRVIDFLLSPIQRTVNESVRER